MVLVGQNTGLFGRRLEKPPDSAFAPTAYEVGARWNCWLFRRPQPSAGRFWARQHRCERGYAPAKPWSAWYD
jgi:hypothetical protein